MTLVYCGVIKHIKKLNINDLVKPRSSMNNHYCPDFQNKYIIEYQNRIRSLPLIRNDTFVHLYLIILEFACIFRNFSYSSKIGSGICHMSLNVIWLHDLEWNKRSCRCWHREYISLKYEWSRFRLVNNIYHT